MGLFQEVCPSVFSYAPFTCSITHCPTTCGRCFFPNLTNLQVLNLAHNHLSGAISGQDPISLRVLDLSSNSFAGEILTNFFVTHQLQLINLSFNDFSGAIPMTIGALQ
ncbi:putative inactive leucine-rich repeat receptor kinase XIAO [Forsythia ovata]|uniref:Inactive leucine-rich repeat receptor kinase XIAO n=1 Tax=Forsythia ovata TaxID=205694 RepID=A0ABD1T9S9_9LAMI